MAIQTSVNHSASDQDLQQVCVAMVFVLFVIVNSFVYNLIIQASDNILIGVILSKADPATLLW